MIPLELVRADISTLTFSGDESRLALVRPDGSVAIVDLAASARVQATPARNARYVALDQTGARLAIGTQNALEVWDLNQRRRIARVPNLPLAFAVALSPDGRLATYAGGSFEKQTGDVRLFEVDGQVRRWTLPDVGRVQRLRFTPDGGQLTVSGEKPFTPVLDVASGAELFRFTHRGRVRDVAFDSSGRYLGVVSDDRFLRVYRPDTRTEVVRNQYPGPVLSVGFTSDASTVWCSTCGASGSRPSVAPTAPAAHSATRGSGRAAAGRS
jgi:WD40 repeat protein